MAESSSTAAALGPRAAVRLPNRAPPPPLPAWRHLALRRRIIRGPDRARPCLAPPRPVSRPLLQGSRLASSRGSAACGPQVEPLTSPLRAAGRRTPLRERDARCAHAHKTECGSDCVQHSSLGGGSWKARRCACTYAGRSVRGNQLTEGQTAGKRITGPGRVGPIGKLPCPGTTEIEMQIGG